jgi:DNA-binding IclR family transcriptional regulator
VLNTLERRQLVRRDAAGAYLLGRRLIELAAQVSAASGYNFVEIGTPFLERLSEETGEASKISIRDNEQVLVVATAHGAHEYGLTINPGRLLPLHAGAAGKLLLASLEPGAIARILAKPLSAFTPRTPVYADKLLAELRAIKARGWASDEGEYSPFVNAFAAPVRDPDGQVVAAVSVPFLGGKTKAEREAIRLAVRNTARKISEALHPEKPGDRPQREAKKSRSRVSA